MKHIWLRSGSLLYRLNDKPVNSHMIEVQMNGESIQPEQRAVLAEKLETLFNVSTPAMVDALELAREWITEAIAQGCKLPCANTMQAIRDALKDVPEI